MNYLTKFCENLSKITGISSKPITLVVYTIFALIIIDLITKGLILANTQFKNSKRLYTLNKKIKAFRIMLIFVSIIFIWEKQIQNMLTFISVIGAATTLALREIISNFFAGIYIKLYKPFRLEDRIEVNGETGDIVNINTLSFEILEVSNKNEGEQSTGIIVRIPNSKIFTEQIKNYTKAFKYIWSELTIKVKYDCDLSKN